MRVLIIEDNERLAEFIGEGLRLAGIESDHVSQGRDGLTALCASLGYSLVILDLGLPDISGMDVLKQIRAEKNMTPVLILTAREGVRDRVDALNNGADDYLMKPFAMDELTARVKALLRRPGHALGQLLTAGNIALDTINREVRIDGRVQGFTRRETDMLERFLSRPGRVLSKKTIEEGLYSHEDEGSSNSVEAIVSRLRKKLEAAQATANIHTLRGIGYLLSEQGEISAE